MMYNRAWFWISQFDWSEDEDWIIELKVISNDQDKIVFALTKEVNR